MNCQFGGEAVQHEATGGRYGQGSGFNPHQAGLGEVVQLAEAQRLKVRQRHALMGPQA